jgi:hypothetical protein
MLHGAHLGSSRDFQYRPYSFVNYPDSQLLYCSFKPAPEDISPSTVGALAWNQECCRRIRSLRVTASGLSYWGGTLELRPRSRHFSRTRSSFKPRSKGRGRGPRDGTLPGPGELEYLSMERSRFLAGILQTLPLALRDVFWPGDIEGLQDQRPCQETRPKRISHENSTPSCRQQAPGQTVISKSAMTRRRRMIQLSLLVLQRADDVTASRIFCTQWRSCSEGNAWLSYAGRPISLSTLFARRSKRPP